MESADFVAVLVLLAAAVVVLDFVAVHTLISLSDGLVKARGVGYPIAAESNGEPLFVRSQLAQVAYTVLEIEFCYERHQDEEFIAADAVGVLDAVALREQACRTLERRIARLVAKCIVDFLEAIDIGIDNARTTRMLHQEVHPLHAGIAVVEPRQGVMAAQVFELHHQPVVHDLRRDEV